MHLINLNNIYKSYGTLNILSDINMTIDYGKTYAIVGNSGTGKSTLLHIMALLDKPTEGEVILEDNNISALQDKKISEIRNKKFGFIFQDNYLLEDYSALENVMIPALIAKSDKDIAEKNALRLLESVGLKDRINHLPSQLSGGEKQRVSLCRSLINDPEIVFADEPTGSLDEESAQSVEKLLIDTVVCNEKKTLVLVTHNTEFADKCDNVYQLKNHGLKKIK